MTAPANDATLRLDKWLWFARLCKTRSLAQKLIERGQAILNGAPVEKAGTLVQAGDTLTVILGPVKRTLTVAAVGARRGPAAEARSLYREKEPPQRLPPGEEALPLRRFR